MGKVAQHPAVGLQPPVGLAPDHRIAEFKSAEPALDMWLAERAASNEAAHHSRTVVVATADRVVVGFYALSSGSIQRAQATRRVRQNAPDPIPVMLLARLAVAQGWEGRGIGAGLLKDAVKRTVAAGQIAGMAALLTHAKSEDAARFYTKHGFKPSPLDPLTFMLSMAEIASAL